MQQDTDKKNGELLQEIERLRQRVAELEKQAALPAIANPLNLSQPEIQKPHIRVGSCELQWQLEEGIFISEQFPAILMWLDTTLAGLMSGFQAMVGTERFALALQSEGRKSVETDWFIISQYSNFPEGFAALATMARTAGWGYMELIDFNETEQKCKFRVKNSWEGRYQKALGVCWSSGIMAGKFAGFCSKLFQTNCWSEQTAFIARGDEFDEFTVQASPRSIEEEINQLLATDKATRADMAVALYQLQQEVAFRKKIEAEQKQVQEELEKQAEALENQQKWLEAVLDLLPTATVFVEPETARVTFANKIANQLAGGDFPKYKSLEEYPAVYYCTDASGERIPTERMPGAVVARGEKLEGFEMIWDTPGGARSLACWGESLPPMYGREAIGICMFQDVTKLKQTEEALRQVEERLRLALVGGQIIAWDLDLKANHLVCSDNASEIWGIEAGTLENFLSLIHPDDRQLVIETYDRLLSAGGAFEIDYRIAPPNREVLWLHSQGKIHAGADGQPQRISGVSVDITHAKQTEQAQREAEERLRVAVKNSPLTVFNHDRELRYTWMYNPTFDYSPDAVVGKRDEDLFRPEDAAVLTGIKRRVLETGIGRREEVKIRALGRDWYFDLTVEPLRDSSGEVVGITCATVDMSERRQAEAEREQLLASERAAREQAEKAQRQLTAIFETSPVGIGFLDGEQRFVAINEALAEINGLSREQHLGHSIPELFGQSDPHVVEVFDRLYATGEPFTSPQFAVNVPGRDDRRPGYYNVYYLPTRDRAERVEGVLVYVVDVTDRVRLERGRNYLSEASTVLASSLDYQTTLERVAQLSVPELADWCVVHLVAEDGSIEQIAVAHNDPAKLEWARQIQQKYPVDASEARGAGLTLRTGQPDLVPDIPDEMLVHGARDPEHLEFLRQVGLKSVMTVPLQTQERILGVISFVAAESGRRYDQNDLMLAMELASRASIAIDNARLYRTAQRDRAAAEQANRVKDEFLAVLSHELRTPLNPILGWARLLRGRSLNENKAALALETIERNAKLQAQLIEDLLDISRILQGKLSLTVTSVNLKTIIQAAMETVRLSAEAKGIELRAAIAPNVGLVLGDANRLQQVFWNLLSNAIKFTPSGGRVEISLQQVGSQARIAVSDSGAGISAEFLPHVFEAFRQADATTTRRFGGLGLGLSIARHLVELHGGTISAQSAGEGLGSTFAVTLPLQSASQSRERRPSAATSSPHLDGIRVLAVDDERDSLEMLQFLLEGAGAAVTAVSSAAEALAVLAQFEPDIILSDIGMPEMDGYAMMRQIRTRLPSPRGQVLAIALTAYAGEYDRQQALAAGFQLHVSKPVEPVELIAAISSLLARSRPV